MPLSSLQANMVVQWVQSRSNAPFAPTRQGADSLEYNLSDLNQIFDVALNPASSSSTTVQAGAPLACWNPSKSTPPFALRCTRMFFMKLPPGNPQ